MSERSDDERELVDLLVAGSLTPDEFERARAALQCAAPSHTSDPVAASEEGWEASGTADGFTGTQSSGRSLSLWASTAAARLRPTRRQAGAGAVLAALAAIVVGAIYVVPPLLGEINELDPQGWTTASDWRLSESDTERMNVELLTVEGDDFVVSWAFVNQVRVGEVRVRPAPEQQLVAVWADQPLTDAVEADSIELWVGQAPRFLGIPRVFGSRVVVASVYPEADVTLEVVSGGQSEVLDLRRSSRALEALEPPAAPDGDSQGTRSRANTSPRNALGWPTTRVDDESNEPDKTSPRNELGWPTTRVDDESQDSSGAAPSPDDPQQAEEAPPTPLVDARFEGHIPSGQDAVDFSRFLAQHAREVVDLDITVPHEGEVITRQNSSFYIDVDPAEHDCPECGYFYSISFQGDGPPATAQQEGPNVRIKGYFFAESTSEGTGDPIPNALIAGGPVEHALTE